VCYWRGRELIFENYAAQTRVAATPLAVDILHVIDRWRPAGELARQFPDVSPAAIARALVTLIRLRLVDSSRAPRDPRADALAAWKDWSPAASFFHLSTKDAHAPAGSEEFPRRSRRPLRAPGMPPAVKSYASNRQIALPPPDTAGEVARVLLARRTWRQFSRRPIALDTLATLLGLSFGVQWWFDLDNMGRVALKTSPSGGSRHPIEAYVIALRVSGLGRGLYHYNAGTHRLELLRRGTSARQVSRYVNGQTWFGGAAAVVLMTAVFARTQWKYPGSRAYRAVLIEAGHVCQTFCVAATSLGLAPFCTMAMADSAIEADLAIDGVSESVLYAAGVGSRPSGTDWAPWHSAPGGRRSPNSALRSDTTGRPPASGREP
jgi:SagB-type dehydrogenase family enzyme